MIIQIQISDNNLEWLVSQAIMNGFLRQEPHKKWTLKEKKDAARYAILYWLNIPVQK